MLIGTIGEVRRLLARRGWYLSGTRIDEHGGAEASASKTVDGLWVEVKAYVWRPRAAKLGRLRARRLAASALLAATAAGR